MAFSHKFENVKRSAARAAVITAIAISPFLTRCQTDTINAAKSKIVIEKKDTVEINQKLFDAAKKGDVAGVQNALEWAAYNKNTDMMRLLIGKGADVNARADDGGTVLMRPAVGGNIEETKLLIAKGADVNAKTDYGWTALMYAAVNCNTEVMQLLIENGADVNAKNNDGLTSLMYVKQSKKSLAKNYRTKYDGTIKLLKKNGAK